MDDVGYCWMRLDKVDFGQKCWMLLGVVDDVENDLATLLNKITLAQAQW